MSVQLNNTGRLIQQIPGITGVAAGGTAIVNLPVNARYHCLEFQMLDNGVLNTANLTAMRIVVNGINMRDITPANVRNISAVNGIAPANGVIPIHFTEPWRNLLNPANDTNSWDLAGQSTFLVQFSIAAAAVNPTLTGIWEIDYLRNVRTEGNAQVPFLQPVSQHQFTFQGVGGQNPIVQLPYDYPITRMWVSSGLGNNITLLEVFQDGNKIVEGTPAQLNRRAADYGYLVGGANPFECAAIFDMDQRWWKALKCANSLNFRVTLANPDTINIVQETLPGAYSS